MCISVNKLQSMNFHLCGIEKNHLLQNLHTGYINCTPPPHFRYSEYVTIKTMICNNIVKYIIHILN